MRTMNVSSVLGWALASAGLAAGCVGVAHVPPDAAVTDASQAPDARITPDAPRPVDVGMRTDAPRTADAYAAPDAGPPPSFDDLYTSILVPRCGGCHIEEGATAAYRPRLSDVDTAYAQLFDVPVETSWAGLCAPTDVALFRVRAFDVDTSLLAFLPDCYIRDASHALPDDELAQIRAWIAAGADRGSF